MATTGNVTVDFGATPISEITGSVVGQAAILAISQCEAWVMEATTANNNANSHQFAGVSFSTICGIPTAGVGFTIYVTSRWGLVTGQFVIQWVWN